MSLQTPPNGSGSVIATLTNGGKEYPIGIIADATTPTQQQAVDANGNAHVVSAPVDGAKASYSAALTALSPGTSATTVVAQITGSASTVVRVTKVRVSATEATAAAYHNVQIVKSSTAIAGGTPVAGTKVPNDSSNAAATNTVQGFSATPTAGTAVGTVRAAKLFCPVTGTPAAGGNELIFDFGQLAQAIVLRGVAQSLDVKINGETPANAGSWNISFEWTEE